MREGRKKEPSTITNAALYKATSPSSTRYPIIAVSILKYICIRMSTIPSVHASFKSSLKLISLFFISVGFILLASKNNQIKPINLGIASPAAAIQGSVRSTNQAKDNKVRESKF